MASPLDKTQTPTAHSPSTSRILMATALTPPRPQLSPGPRLALNRDDTGSRYVVVVMGVSGTGKSTLGAALAGALGVPFVDGDDLHPAANVAKMSRGEPLDDGDRLPWLEIVRETAVERAGRVDDARRAGVVVACSSLKKTYRAVLRGEGTLPTYFVYLKGEEGVLMARMEERRGHFMKAGMLASQLRTLESPEGEPGVVTVSVETSTEAQVQQVVDALRLCTV